ncbi:hypothetical protein [Vibrio metschnikovii]|uniref:hypothetical protein n=1 Tax=Vibrio metschnikovii TaxID=28172 RepID=UPI00164B82AC|nr:hypothetical protein [Vibrio metschnikovii]MBC5830116.1 hypothetical protein [Vibrio metschnikovii]
MATDSFFNRWSKRKLDQAAVSEGEVIEASDSGDKALPSALPSESDSELSTTLTRNQTAYPAESVPEESLATENALSTLLVSASAELKKRRYGSFFSMASSIKSMV